MALASRIVDPLLRIQVLLENEPGTPTKEFKAGDLPEPSFDALVSHIFKLSKVDETNRDQYDTVFKYYIEERHESRWIVFTDTRGFGYAIQSNQDKDYVFLSASILKKGATRPSPLSPVGTTTKTKVVKKKTTSTKAKAPSKPRDSKVPVEQLILIALREQLDLGITAPSRIQICASAGYKNLHSKGYVAAMKKLKTSGFIEYPDKDSVSLTQEGATHAPSTAPRATTNAEIQARLKNMLKDKAVQVFDILSDGQAHNREEVCYAIGYQHLASKGFVAALKQMKALNILTSPEDNKKMIQLTDIAFPFGRPSSSNDSASVVSN